MADERDADLKPVIWDFAHRKRGEAGHSGKEFLRGSFVDVLSYFNLNFEDRRSDIERLVAQCNESTNAAVRAASESYLRFSNGNGRFDESVRDLLMPIMKENAQRYFEMQLMQDIEKKTHRPHSGRRITVNGVSKLAHD